MKANEFNEKHEVGTSFMYIRHPAVRGGPYVKTVSEAFQVNRCAWVNIDMQPHLVKVETLVGR